MTKDFTLLSDELRSSVDAALDAAYVKAEKHYGQTFTRPTVRYNIRNTNGGEAHIRKNLIRLNLMFLVENTEHFLKTTVPHEVAHMVAHAVYDTKPMNGKKVRPHGAEWREVMELFGLVPPKEFQKHRYDITSLDLTRRPRVKRTAEERRARRRTALLAAYYKLLPEDQALVRDEINLD